MSAQTVDPFDLEQTGPPRDRWTRPLLIPPNGGERIPYTRMSTLGDYLCDDFGIGVWQRRLLAIGLSEREDLCAMTAALPALNDAKCDKRSLTKPQREQDVDTKKKLDEYIDQALETAGRNYKANMGTAIHGLIERGDVQTAPVAIQSDVAAALDAIRDAGMTVLASEVFVANDELQAAGSFDHIIDVPLPGWGPVVADVKTGSVSGKDLAFAVQVAGYAGGVVYDWHDDTRSSLDTLCDGRRLNRKRGLIIHVPLGGGRCDFYAVDLMIGAHAARLATQVRKARTLTGLLSKADF